MSLKQRVGHALLVGVCGLATCVLSVATRAQDIDEASSHYAPTPAVSYPGGVRSLRDVTFGELSGFRPLTLDLYLPAGAGAPKPTVVFLHGGAWRHRTAREGGTFRDFPSVLASLAARGYVVASVNYRFVGEAHFPGPVKDTAMAIRWLRTHAAEYNIDPARFVVWGSSAGGQIATVVGAACGDPILDSPAPPPLVSACVQGVIDWYGLVDLESHAADLGKADVPATNKDPEAYLGCELAKCPAGFVRSASALAYIDAKDPPFLIQHGAADVTVSAKQSQKLYAALRAAGVPAEIVLYPGVSHGFAREPGGGADDAVNRQAMDKVVEFLGRLFPKSRT